ncbi:hypothetical protein OAQ80_05980 [Flavobacteriaceae bacterium]|nr:hypothetical protein [Flavobacteriaceae bacterium]
MKKVILTFLCILPVSCVNYDDDIRDLNEEIEVLKEKNIAQDLVLDDLDSQISSIKQQQANDASNLNNRLDLLEQSLDGFNNIVASLQASNTLLNSELASIKSDLSSLTTDVSSLTTDVSSTGTSQSVSSTQASINALDSQISVLSNNLTAALNRISTLEASNNSSSSTGSSTTITYTVTETVQLQIDWLRYFVPFAVNDSGWLQRSGSSLAEQGGLTVLFNHITNEVNFPSLPQYSFPLSEQFRVEDESGNIIELLQTGTNWKATISSSATKIRFLYKYSSSPFQLYTTPYIEIKPSYNKFYVSFSADITYSNITDTW